MSGKMYHFCLSVRGALNGPKHNLEGMMQLTPEARDYLMDQLALGREVVPIGKCDNFDYKYGCQGHECKEVP